MADIDQKKNIIISRPKVFQSAKVISGEMKPWYPPKYKPPEGFHSVDPKTGKRLDTTQGFTGQKARYIPTHFRRRAPKLSNFTGDYKKFSYKEVRDAI